MSSSAALDLAFGVIAMLVIFVLATSARRTLAIGALLVMIPFQVVETRYGSSSVLMAYALAAVLLLTGPLKLRMLPALGFIVLGYLVSFVMADRENLLLHAVAMVQFFSALVVFILSYNFARSVETEGSALTLLLVINALVVGYCVLQLTAGPGERFTPFGIDALAFNVNRTPDDPRLVGPFGNPGSTAGYFTLMTLVCAVAYMFVRGGKKLLVQLLIGLNLLGIVVTGNRTGFLTLLVMFPLFLFVFRSELGAKRIAAYLFAGAATLVVASAVAIYFTDFDRMFGRLERVTETEAGVPSTRSETWPIAIEKIRRDPWFGEGPYYPKADALMESGEMRIEFEELGDVTTAFDPYPHSLYLFLLRTVGIVGLLPVVGFFLATWMLLYAASRRESANRQGSAIVRMGLLLIPAFLVAQITLEFNRPETLDYAHFIFALMGLMVGTADRERQPARVLDEESHEERRARHGLFGTEPAMR
jgi:O-antigen ligase